MRFEFSKKRGFLQVFDGTDRNIIDFENATLEGLDITSRPGVSASSALPTVDDSEDPDGAVRYVSSIRSSFILDKTSTAVTSSMVTLPTKSGVGRWLRLPGFHPSWLTQPDWWIDPTNGSDENVGDQSSTALKTDGERQRRLGVGARIDPPYNNDTFSKLWRLHILGTLPATDPIVLNLSPAQDTTVYVIGGVESVDWTGTFTALTAKNPVTNTPFSVTDSTLPAANSWTAHRGKRIRITGGPRVGTIMWVDKDLGNRQARVSDPSTVPAISGAAADSFYLNTPTPQTPQVGDPYVVETLRTVNFFKPHLRFEGNSDFSVSYGSNLVIGELALGIRDEIDVVSFEGEYVTITYSCRFAIVYTSARNYYSLNDCVGSNSFGAGGILWAFGGQLFKWGGLVTSLAGTAWISAGAGSMVALDYDAMISRGQFQCHRAVIGKASIWDTPSNAGTVGGHAVFVGGDTTYNVNPTPGASLLFGQYSSSGSPRLWGTGAAGAGVFVAPGSTFAYPAATLPTISGSGGQFSLAGATTGRPWNETSGSYASARATTWSNLTGSIALGGFNGNANNVALGARVIAQ